MLLDTFNTSDFFFVLFKAISLLLLLVWIVQKIRRMVTDVRSHWHHHFDTVSFSPEQFYAILEEEIARLEIPSLSLSRVTYMQSGVLSARREYLRVSRHHLVFDVCAAPFAKGFFVSWWQGDTLHLTRKIVANTPFIGLWLEHKIYKQTYYQMDTEQMFRDSIHASVLSTIEILTASYGIRPLSELDRRAENVTLRSRG